MPSLALGPVLRHISERSATLWVETDSPCTVDILGRTSPTFTAYGHHYALVVVDGLSPGTSTPYEVRLDGELVWPQPGGHYPPSTIRTLGGRDPVRVLFGSCRHATPATIGKMEKYPPDALDAYAVRMAAGTSEGWPDLLLLLGDQVYADETSPATQDWLRTRRDVTEPPGLEVANFEEYTQLYSESWTDPDVRWLLSTVPTAMIFDDHDVRDDWNTSAAWRQEVRELPWWHDRITGGLASYWIYQHLGNLSPAELASEPVLADVRAASLADGDAAKVLTAFAERADAEADGQKGYRWSFRIDLGRTRVVVIDSRCGRILESAERSMLGSGERDWIREQVSGDYDHLLLGTSLPWLLPQAIHDLEAWNEVLCASPKPRKARFGEWMRRTGDLEHWAAFKASFDWLADLLGKVGRGELGGRPATACVLSGDVHHAYVAEANYDQPMDGRVYQITCSPVHNAVPAYMRWGFRAGWGRAMARVGRMLRRMGKLPKPSVSWTRLGGPFFGNEVALLSLHGRAATLDLERCELAGDGRPQLVDVAKVPLSE